MSIARYLTLGPAIAGLAAFLLAPPAEAWQKGKQAAQPPSRTLWLPEDGQTHPVGALSKSGDLNWIACWAGNNKKGVLSRTGTANLPAGNYRAIVQVFHKQKAGKKLCELRVLGNDGKQVVARSTVTSATFENYINGGYQRTWVDFTVPAGGGKRSVEVYDFNNHYIWVGSISIQKKGRPIYVMAHRMNNITTFNQALKDGANVVETDIHPYKALLTPDKNIKEYEFLCYHYGDAKGKHTPRGDFNKFLANIKAKLDSKELVLAVLDCKLTYCEGWAAAPYSSADLKKYATSLVAKLNRHKIPAHLVMLSVPAANAKELHKHFQALKYNCGLDAYVETSTAGNRDFPKIRKWARDTEDSGVTFAGTGKDEAVRGEFFRWAYWVTGLINQRDTGRKIKKVYFWTVNNKSTTRQLLDYGVDGILTDYPRQLRDILNEPQYKGVFRLATQNDSQFKHFLE